MQLTAIEPYYDIGTATLSTANRSVIGVGTSWLANVVPGDLVYGADGRMGGVVEIVNSNTSITLVKNWRGANQTAGLYTIFRVSDSVRVENFSQRLLNLLLGGNVSALGGLTLVANKGIHATGAGAFETHDLTPFARTLLDDADAATARSTLGANNANNLTSGSLEDARLREGLRGVSVYLSDMNLATENGFYRTTSSTANSPSATNGAVIVISISATATSQLFFTLTSGRCYYRYRLSSVWSDWRNIGAPEGGANSNGRYVSLSDGTAICVSSVTLSQLNSSALGATWTFPVAFLSPPSVSGTGVWSTATGGIGATGYQSHGSLSVSTISSSGTSLRLGKLSGSDFPTGAQVDASVMAIGRWY